MHIFIVQRIDMDFRSMRYMKIYITAFFAVDNVATHGRMYRTVAG